MRIGNLVKNRRIQLNMTQNELAKNICTQATISKLEKNHFHPSEELIKKLADRLDVSVVYFSEENYSISEHEVLELKEKITFYINQNEYEKVHEIINNNQGLINNVSDINLIYYFEWVDSILDYYLRDNAQEALRKLNILLEEAHEKSILYINIMGILGIIYYEEKHFEVADEYFEKAIASFDKETSYKEQVKIYYNYALNLESLNRIKESLEFTLKSIDILIDKDSLYLLGYLYYYKGYLLEQYDDFDGAIEAYNVSSIIFKMKNYTKMYNFSRITLVNLKKKIIRLEVENEKN